MKKLLLIFLLLLLSFWTVKPLFNQGFFNVHDNVQVERVFEMGQALKEGQFPVRWVKDLGYGYGYPIFNFYAPLPYYAGGVFNLLGVDALVATKLMFAIGILLAGVAMFFLAREFWGGWGGMLSAVLYTYSPYHALDIYVRGAVDEFWALAFLPLVFLGMHKISKENNRYGVIIGSFGLTGVILSHNLTALMLIPFLVLYFLILFIGSPQKKSFLRLISYFLLLSLALSAFYWLPALLEMKYTNVVSQIGGAADFHKHFIQISQIWDFPWGFGGSAGLQSGLSFKIGKPNIILGLVGILIFLILSLRGVLTKSGRRSNLKNQLDEIATSQRLLGLAMTDKKGIIIFGGLGLLLSVYFTNSLSLPIWNAFSPMAYIQYPWRFLGLAAFFCSFLGGFVVLVLPRVINANVVKVLTVAAIIFVIFFHYKYFRPQEYLPKTSSDYTNISHLRWEASKISNEYLPKDFPPPRNPNELSLSRVATKPEISTKVLIDKSTENLLNTKGDGYSTVSIMSANFPGWKVWVDTQKVELASSQFLTFTISRGTHVIESKFTNTPVRSLANLISLFGLVLLAVIIKKSNYEKST